MGVEKNGEPGPNFALGPEIHAKITMFCEGCRGSTSKQLIRRFKLDAGNRPQTYGLGLKELWQLPPGGFSPASFSTRSVGRSTAALMAAVSFIT